MRCSFSTCSPSGLMRNLFQNPDFTHRNIIAAQVQNVIEALASTSFSTSEFLRKLDPYYKAIEREGANLSHFTEKQDFLNSVYEQFFQRFSPNIADTHGIVYTPREIVEFMCNSVEQALKDEFGFTLSSPEVVILDPCTGTGNFIVNLIERIPGKALPDAYHNRLFANEVMLLPYYVASLNIEHAYYERMRTYEAFDGLCFVDTLDMAQARQFDLFTRYKHGARGAGKETLPSQSSSATRPTTSARRARTTTTRTANIRTLTATFAIPTRKIPRRPTRTRSLICT